MSARPFQTAEPDYHNYSRAADKYSPHNPVPDTKQIHLRQVVGRCSDFPEVPPQKQQQAGFL